eukprot:COSAG02_NODE_11694_length_1672_cov_2.715830_1_plen_167_part_00
MLARWLSGFLCSSVSLCGCLSTKGHPLAPKKMRRAALCVCVGIPPELVQLMHGGVGVEQLQAALEGRQGGGGQGRGRRRRGRERTAPRVKPPAFAPWRLDSLRSHFGSSKLEELGGRVNEPDENRRLMALADANGDVDIAAAMLESAGEARAAEIGAGRVKAARPS